MLDNDTSTTVVVPAALAIARQTLSKIATQVAWPTGDGGPVGHMREAAQQALRDIDATFAGDPRRAA
jgi:hypothetical protein